MSLVSVDLPPCARAELGHQPPSRAPNASNRLPSDSQVMAAMMLLTLCFSLRIISISLVIETFRSTMLVYADSEVCRMLNRVWGQWDISSNGQLPATMLSMSTAASMHRSLVNEHVPSGHTVGWGLVESITELLQMVIIITSNIFFSRRKTVRIRHEHGTINIISVY